MKGEGANDSVVVDVDKVERWSVEQSDDGRDVVVVDEGVLGSALYVEVGIGLDFVDMGLDVEGVEVEVMDVDLESELGSSLDTLKVEISRRDLEWDSFWW